MLKNWTIYKYPLESYGIEIKLIDGLIEKARNHTAADSYASTPSVYWGEFKLPNDVNANPPPDTFLDLGGWFKVSVCQESGQAEF